MAKRALHTFGMDGLRALADGLSVKPWEAKKGEALNQGHYAGALCEALVDGGATLNTLQAVVMVSLAGGEAWRGMDSQSLKEACGLYGVSVSEAKVMARDEMKVKKGGKGGKTKEAPASTLTHNRNAMEEIQKRSILGERDEVGEAECGLEGKSIPAEPGEWVYGHELLDRLKPHLGGKHVEGRDWLAVLAGMAVRKSEPNEHGVYWDTRSPEPLKWKGAKKNDGVNLELALDKEKATWHVGCSYSIGDRSGGCGASETVTAFPTREQAIECGLRMLCDRVKSVGVIFNVLDDLLEVLMDACPGLSAGRTVDEVAAVECYHCDGCGKVCEVAGDKVAEVSAMDEGAFRCVECDATSSFEPLPADEQGEWEVSR